MSEINSRSGRPAGSARKPTARRSPAHGRQNAAIKPEARGHAGRTASGRGSARGGDLFLEARVPAQKPAKKGGKRRSNGGTALYGTLCAVLLVGIGLLVVLMMRQNALHADFLMMRSVVDQQTFYDGTTVEGIDVSHMTLSAAMDYWRERVEPGYAGRAATFDNGASVTSRDLGYTSDYESVLTSAWSAGRSGSLEERYRKAASRRENPVAYSVSRTDYNAGIVEQYAKLVAQQVDRPAQNAVIQSFDPETKAFTFTESQLGGRLDQQALVQSIETTISSGGGEIALPVTVLKPQTTAGEVASRYGMIASATTNASSSSKGRLNNIRLAMSFINGTCVKPGEVFSFNGTVGKRTTERGFQTATAYSSGEVTEQVGGGICQVSTTLFNAVAKADLEIVERHNHSLTVRYVDKGKDATVNWGSQDFRFRNTTDDDVYICCELTSDKRVLFSLYGKLLPNGETITIEAVTTRTLQPTTEYQATTALASGQTVLVQTGRVGYEAEAYKIRWDAQGNQIGKELLCKSRYPQRNEIIQYGAEQ